MRARRRGARRRTSPAAIAALEHGRYGDAETSLPAAARGPCEGRARATRAGAPADRDGTVPGGRARGRAGGAIARVRVAATHRARRGAAGPGPARRCAARARCGRGEPSRAPCARDARAARCCGAGQEREARTRPDARDPGLQRRDDRPSATARASPYVGMAAAMLGSAQRRERRVPRGGARGARSRSRPSSSGPRCSSRSTTSATPRSACATRSRVNPESPRRPRAAGADPCSSSRSTSRRAGAEIDRALAVEPEPRRGARDARRDRASRHGPRRAPIGSSTLRSRSTPNDLEALSVRAAVRFLADDAAGFDARCAEVLAAQPASTREFYQIVAEYADWEHRYPTTSSRMAREALAHRPGRRARARDARAEPAPHGRRGRRARGAPRGVAARPLQRARLQHAEPLRRRHRAAVRDGRGAAVRRSACTAKSGRCSSGYVPPHAARRRGTTWCSATASPRSDAGRDRAVRDAAALLGAHQRACPNVGVQGVCFGQVVDRALPARRPFNWGRSLWHELAHVFHIQLSQQPRAALVHRGARRARDDRWRARSGGARRTTRSALALEGDRLPPVRDLQRGVHPRAERPRT